MEFLSDDPTYLAGGLGILAGAFLIATKLTQQGKYLLWAGVSLALAVAVVGVEWVWVTDNERIEETVYGLARAVAASDTPGVLDRLTPDVQYVTHGHSLPSEMTRGMVESYVKKAKFDILRISHLEVSVGGHTRRGQAEFQVYSSGSFRGSSNDLNFAAKSTWSLGLRETTPGVWKVNRITPVSLPGRQSVLPTGLVPPSPARRLALSAAPGS